MGELSSTERQAVEQAAAEPMLDQVLGWSAVNSGSRNLAGLGTVAGMLADAFAALPGEMALSQPTPVDAIDAARGEAQGMAERGDTLYSRNAGKLFDIDHLRAFLLLRVFV